MTGSPVALITEATALGAGLPAGIRFGTSSWTFEGWKELIYKRGYKSKAAFSRDSLEEYAQCPLFRAVGVDSTFYRPPTVELLNRYYEQAPRLQLTVKAWQEITSYRYPDNFLNKRVFEEAALRSFSQSKLSSSGSQLLLQFSRVPETLVKSGEFIERLSALLALVPSDVRLGVEVRNVSLLCADYVSVLNRAKTAHVFSWSTEMPELLEQLRLIAQAGGLESDRYVVRALIPPGFNYEETKADYAPFDQIKRPAPQLHDDLQRVIQRARVTGREATVLFNNKAEGSAPLSVANAIVRTVSTCAA